MRFVYVHLALYGAWIAVNLGAVPGIPEFDPSFVVLAMVASVEAIFLSTFVLISQNRMMVAADKRADLDLHVSLLTEHELTKLVELVAALAERAGVRANADPEIEGRGGRRQPTMMPASRATRAHFSRSRAMRAAKTSAPAERGSRSCAS